MPDEPTATTDGSTPNVAEVSAPRSTTNGDKNPKRATTVEAETTDDEIVRVTSNLVPVTAIVQDEQGKAITDLELKDFELSVDGQLKPIGDLSRSETPVRMALLFDNSKSVRGTREFEKQAAVRFFRSVMRPVDLAAIYSVQTVFDLEQPLTGDVPRLVRTIEHFGEPEGATRLLDAIIGAADYLRTQRGRKVIVIVSDGTDTVSDASFDDTLRRVIADDCQVYTVQTGVAVNANLYDLMAVRRMESLATQTGGAVYIPKSYAELDAAFAQISADLAHQYVLSYYANDDRRDSRFRVISVRVATRPRMRVRARRGYYPRKPPEPPTTSDASTFSDKARARRAYLPSASQAQ